MRHALLLFASSALVMLAGCRGRQDAPPPPAPPGAPAPAPPVPAAPPAAVPAGEQPCIVGRWQANDFLEMVRANARHNLRGNARLTAAGGTITFEMGPRDEGGTGELVASADELVHRAQTRESGVRVTLSHTMNGRATMPYRIPADGMLSIEEPTESDLTARVSLRATGGLRLNRGSSPRVDFTGMYSYECTPEQLSVWRVGARNNRLGQPMVFDRAPEEG